jgi:uncharacterized protein YciI
MLYAIVAEDGKDTLELRLKTRPAHLKRLEEMQAQGRIAIAGPLPAIDSEDPGPAGFTGSIMIVEFDTLQEAEAWAQADPYVSAGVYAKVSVKPFKKTFPR